MDLLFIAMSIHFHKSLADASADAIGSAIGTADSQHYCYCWYGGYGQGYWPARRCCFFLRCSASSNLPLERC